MRKLIELQLGKNWCIFQAWQSEVDKVFEVVNKNVLKIEDEKKKTTVDKLDKVDSEEDSGEIFNVSWFPGMRRQVWFSF